MAAVMMVAAMGLVSCAEDTVGADPYANWEKRNVEFIDSIAAVAANPPEGETWRKFFDYAISFDKEPGDLLEPYEKKVEDFVYVKYRNADDILDEEAIADAGLEYPVIYGDTLVAAYQGFLINGTRFDGNYSGTFDPEVNDNFTKFALTDQRNNANGGLIAGWVIALMHMKCPMKDAVEIYIPYQLSYGTAGSGSSIPGYSALKFEIYVDEVIKPQLQE